MGQNKLLNTVLLKNINEVKYTHNIITELNKFYSQNTDITLKTFTNFKKELQQIKKGMISSAENIYSLAYAVEFYIYLRNKIYSYENELLSNLFTVEDLNDRLYKDVIKNIKPDGYVESSASKDLRTIRNELETAKSKIKKATNDFFKSAKGSDYTSDDIVSIRDGYSCVAIKAKFKNQVDGVVIDQSATGQTAFVVPRKVLELNSTINKLKHEEIAEIKRILKEYCGKIVEDFSGLMIIDTELLKFDIINAKTKYGLATDSFSPVITDIKFIKVINGFHPLLGEEAVPLDMQLGNEYETMIITGPNTGGKTVVLKTLGLFSLMVQSGIPIPADPASEFCVFDKIFVDIGDDQSIENSLSTFSGHIKKIKHITKNVTDNSLVLLDEVGSGTDPTEGAALAIGIIEYLQKKSPISVISTHFSSVKQYASSNSRITNASMEFDSKTLKPTYKLLPGIPGSSRAFEISRKLGLNNEILRNAKHYLNSDYIDTEKLIAKLQKERKNIEDIKEELLIKERKFDERERKLTKKLNKLEERESKLDEVLKTNESEFLKESRKQFEKIIKELRVSGASKESIKEGLAFFDDSERRVSKKAPKKHFVEEKRKVENLEVGDEVRLSTNGMEGVIIDVLKKGKEYRVQFGVMKLNCNAPDLEKIKTKVGKTAVSYTDYRPSEKKLELDIRGIKAYEVGDRVETFISDSILNNLNEVKILHGTGTGALRKAVVDVLQNSNAIKSFKYEDIGDYGINYGVTVVVLK